MAINGIFDAPIPGQSLTQHPGASPIEHPPLFVHLDEALEYVWEQLHKKKKAVMMFSLIKAGAPIESLARTLLYQGLIDSKWTVDLALLMFQTVVWQIEAMCHLKGIKFKTFNDDKQYTDFIVKTDELAQQKNTLDQANNKMTDLADQGQSGFKGFNFNA